MLPEENSILKPIGLVVSAKDPAYDLGRCRLSGVTDDFFEPTRPEACAVAAVTNDPAVIGRGSLFVADNFGD